MKICKKNFRLFFIQISNNNKESLLTGVFAEFAYAVLFLARINYTLIPVFVHDTVNGTVSFGGYDNNTDWFSGEMGKMGIYYDMIITAWTLPNVNRQKKLLFFEPGEARLLLFGWITIVFFYYTGGKTLLTVVHRRRQIPSLWKDATRPLTVFDTILWSTQLAIFIVGVVALTISRYYLRKYVMSRMHIEQSRREHIRATTQIFGDSLFQYYSVVVAQGSWEGLGHHNHDGKMRNHVNILHVVLGVTLIFGSCLYQGVVLTAFLIPAASLHIDTTADFINYIKFGQFQVATEKAYPFYKIFYDGTVLPTDMKTIGDIMAANDVLDIEETWTMQEVCVCVLQKNVYNVLLLI
jgi:hypothetical protein